MSYTTTTKISPTPVWKDYIQITKPGIIFSNLLGTFAGFFIAARNLYFDLTLWNLLLMTALGTIFVIASSAVVNNIYDSDIDKHMERTKDRALTNGRISRKNAILFASLLILLGEIILYLGVNLTASLTGLIGFLFYGFVYTMSKRKTVFNTEIGCISGAMPPVIGYTAVTGELDLIAYVLFLFMFFWQPPHFYALAMRRAEEYRAVNVPMLPVVKGFKTTKIQSLIYSILTLVASTLLYFTGTLGLWFFITASVLGIVFVAIAIQGFFKKEKELEIKWATKLFAFSIIYITLMFIAMMLAPIFK